MTYSVANAFPIGRPDVSSRPVNETGFISLVGGIEIALIEGHIQPPHWFFISGQLDLKRKPSMIPEIIIDHANVRYVGRILLLIAIRIGALSPCGRIILF